MIDLLKNMKVIDMSQYLMGPICGRTLAEWGADVIKVEPLTGDPQRSAAMSQGVMDGNPAIFEITGSSRRYVALDTRRPEGLEVVKEMIKTADIVLHAFLPKAAKKLGLDYDSLKELNPGIILGTSSGYGLTGPDAGRPGYDGCSYSARAGFIADLRAPDAEPFVNFPGFGDVVGGICLASGVLAAYVKKLETGRGDHVDTSLMGAGMFVGSYPICANPSKHYPVPREENIATAIPYRCSDGNYIQMMGSQWGANFEGWPIVFGDDLPEDYREKWPDYPSVLMDPAKNASLREFFDSQFIKHDRDYWTEKLKQTKIPFDPCLHFRELQQDEHAWEAGFFRKVDCEGFDTGIPIVPAIFKNAGEAEIRNGGIGQDTRSVLKEYGYDDSKIDAMVEDRLIIDGHGYNPADYAM